MLLGVFQRVFKGIEKTGSLRPVFLQSLHLKNEKTGPVVRSFAVLVRSSYGLFLVPRLDFQTLSIPPLPLSLKMPLWATKLLVRDFGSDYTTSTLVMPHSTKTEHTFIHLATFGSAATCRKKAQ